MLRIIHLLESSRFSGAENVVCQIIDLFQDESNIEMLYCSRDGAIRKTLNERGIEFIPLPSLSINEVRQMVVRYNPDIIHAHDMRASVVAAIASIGSKCKVVSHIHNSDFLSRKRSYKSIVYLLLSRAYKKIIWVSNSCFDSYYYKKKIQDKSIILYNVVNEKDILKRAEEPFDRTFDLIYVGRLADPKNPQRLMRICRKVKDNLSNLAVCVVGSGVLEEEVKELSADLHIDDNICFLGYLSNPLPAVRSSKLFVMTSDREGTPMAALEAMALGKPIISTPTDGLCELVDNNVSGYLDWDEDKLAEYIEFLIRDEKARVDFSAKTTEKFRRINNIENYKKVLKSIYENC